jgi:hypothetical protein
MILPFYVKLFSVGLCYFVIFCQPANADPTIPVTTCATSGSQTVETPRSFLPNMLTHLPSGLTIYEYDSFTLVGPKGWRCEGGHFINSVSISVCPNDMNQRLQYGVNLVVIASVDLGGEEQALIWGQTYFPQLVDKKMVSQWLKNFNVKRMPHVSRYKSDNLIFEKSSVIFFETPKKHRGVGLDLFPVGGDPTKEQLADTPTFGFIKIVPDAPNVPCEIVFLSERLTDQLAMWSQIISRNNQVLADIRAINCRN